MQIGESTKSWIGSPYGPDCFALTLKSEYESGRKWKFAAAYTFSIHGENTAESLFSQYDKGIYTYYPSVQYKLAQGEEEEQKKAKDKGRNMWMSGIKTYKNQIKISGSYQFTNSLSCYGQGVYVIQTKDSQINHGVELSCGLEYTLFN